MKLIVICLVVAFGAAGVLAEATPAPAPAKGIVTIADIRDHAPQSLNIPDFVEWLRRCRNVSDVEYQAIVLLTTTPPRQWVRFSVDHRQYRFLLMMGPDDGKVTIVSERPPSANAERR